MYNTDDIDIILKQMLITQASLPVWCGLWNSSS